MTNQLQNEKSPYLLQHSNNPVDWHPWGDEAFILTRSASKPIFLSVGYSTCYWCHVMEKDSFESQEVAEVLNANFVCIKVDREERPDVDALYMDAVMSMTGHGGWPMSVFLTPELKPFFGGTFFPKQQFISLLNRIAEIWNNNRSQLVVASEGVYNSLQTPLFESIAGQINESIFPRFTASLKSGFDARRGGFSRAPKFPPSTQLNALMRIYYRNKNPELLLMLEKTLKCMAYGGIYDHLGGGFSRYSTDNEWLVPHFEKMLYDNALLAKTYAEAFKLTRNDEYRFVTKETLDYLLRDMRSSDGLFYSAEDAGEVEKEGEYYVFSLNELEKELGKEELELACLNFNITKAGNFENGTNVLSFNHQTNWEDKYQEPFKGLIEKLFSIRKKRLRPHLDDKILCAWNALAISALITAYEAFGESRYLEAAKVAIGALKERLYVSGKLLRRFRDCEAKVNAFLDDYAYLIQALLHLYQIDLNPEWISWAKELQTTLDENFWDKNFHGYFYSPPNDSSIIVRKKETFDNATPSANSICLSNLYLFHAYYGESHYLDRANKLSNFLSPALTQFPQAMASALLAVDYGLSGSKQLVVVGSDSTSTDATKNLRASYIPNTSIFQLITTSKATSKDKLPPILQNKPQINSQTTYYLCENNICNAPTLSLNEIKISCADKVNHLA